MRRVITTGLWVVSSRDGLDSVPSFEDVSEGEGVVTSDSSSTSLLSKAGRKYGRGSDSSGMDVVVKELSASTVDDVVTGDSSVVVVTSTSTSKKLELLKALKLLLVVLSCSVSLSMDVSSAEGGVVVAVNATVVGRVLVS